MARLSGWAHRIKITLDHTKVSTDLTQFPVMLRLSASGGANAADMTRVFDELGANSLKLAVTQDDGLTEQYVEIEKWDEVGEEAILWVSKAAWVISSTVDTVLYLYYDSTHADNSTYVGIIGSTPGKAVWDANFIEVFHKSNGVDNAHITGSVTGNSYAKKAADEPIEAAGKIGNAQTYDGNDYIKHTEANWRSADTSGSIIALFKSGTDVTTSRTLFASGDEAGTGTSFILCGLRVTSGKLYIHQRNFSDTADIIYGDTALNTNTWYLGAITSNGSAYKVYVNTAQETSNVESGVNNGDWLSDTGGRDNFSIGALLTLTNLNLFIGQIDELSVSGAERSLAWIAATYYACFDQLVTFEIESFATGVRIAFDSDPFDYPPVWTDVSDDLVSFSTRRGRQHQLDRIEAGTASLLLDNADGNYWPDNAGGDYYPEVKIGKRLNLWAIYDGIFYDLYTGFVRKWNPVWFSQEGQLHPGMQLECVDLQRNLARASIDVDYSSEASGTRVGNVLDDAGWNATERDIDTGKETLQATGAVTLNAMEHLFAVQESELSDLFVQPDGYVRFIERGGRSAVSFATFGTGELPIYDPVFPLDDDLLYNDIRMTITGGTEQTYTDAASITAFGLRTLSRSGLLMTADIAAYLLCLYLLARLHEAKMRIKSFTIKPQEPENTADLWPQALGRDIGDRITLVWTEASIDGDYFIEGIEHSYDYRVGLWETRVQCSDASQYYYTPDETTATLKPTANGDTIQFNSIQGGEATNWESVADDSDAAFVERTTIDAAPIDIFTTENLPVAASAVSEVRVFWRGERSGTDNLRQRAVVKVNSTLYYGDWNAVLNGTWAEYSYAWALSPDTGDPWTDDEVNAMQIGYQSEGLYVIMSTYPQVAECWAECDYTPAW